ncbi:MAG: hypothetical protein ABJA35_17325 [Parafilimonas sp.]
MKKYVLIIVTACICCNVFAQADRNVKQLTQYLFPEFNEGSVLQKSGTVTKTMLNYNTLTQEMIFKQGDQNLALADPASVDTVYLNNRKFVYANNAFYDVALNDTVGLYIQYTSDIISSGAETGFGKTQTSAVSGITDLKSSGKAYALTLTDEYTIKNKTNYFLKKDGKFIAVNNIKDVKKVFAGKEALIDDYAKKNKVSFKNADDVIKLVQFCNSN